MQREIGSTAGVELRQLAAFVTLADRLHFGRAAETLHVTQPTLSKTIRRLEDQVGTRLFHRHNRGVELSPAGKALLEGARLAVEHAARGIADARAVAEGRLGAIVVGYSPALRQTAAAVLSSFADKRPRVEVLHRQEYAFWLEKAVQRGDVQAAIVVSGRLAPMLAAVPLRDAELGCLVSASHPLASRDGVSFSELAGYVLADTEPRNPGWSAQLRQLESAHGFSPKLEVVGDPLGMAHEIVRAHPGLVMLRPLEDLEPGYGRIVSIRPIVTIRWDLIWNPTAETEPVRAFVSIATSLRDERRWLRQDQAVASRAASSYRSELGRPYEICWRRVNQHSRFESIPAEEESTSGGLLWFTGRGRGARSRRRSAGICSRRRGVGKVQDFTRALDEVDATNLPLVGGKGANLGELVRAGMPVPRAFCVTTAAYREFLAASSLRGEIVALLDGLDYEAPLEIERRAAAIRELLLGSPMPAAIEAAISTAYARLEAELGPSVLVSVRSSATAEDLPGMSFAGQQDTYLNVAGVESVLEHVKRCWASLWTDRAIAYRHRQGFRHEDVYLAVVVQEMFPSEVSGVLFTANPVTSNPDELFVNASWGLGEAIVSGKVDADQFVVDKKTLAVKEREIHDKQVMIVVRPDGRGNAEVEVPAERRTVPSLSDEQVAELGAIARRIEEHYGFPQDIEWGLADGRLAVLQAREITGADLDFGMDLEAWQSPQARASLTDGRWVWSRAYSDEVQTGSTSPLFYTDIQPRMTRLKMKSMEWTETPECLGYPPERFGEIPYFRWCCARAYYNLAWERERIRMFIPPFARDEAALWPFPVAEREEIRKLPFNWIRFLWIMLKLHVTNAKISLLGTTGHLYEYLEKWTDHEQALWDALDMDAASTEEILATRQKARDASGFLDNTILPFTIYLFVLPAALRTALEAWCDDDTHTLYGRLSAGLNTKTSEENIAVWALSREIRTSERLMELFRQDDVSAILAALPESEDGRAFKASLDAFVAKYGHRGGAERDAIHPRWRHKPEIVFHSLKPMLSLGDEEDPKANEDRLRERMLEAKEEALSRARTGGLGGLKAPFLKWLIEVTQDYVYYRDFERFWNDRTMSRVHDIYKAIARKFIGRGLMQDEEDIFFLGRDEVVAVEEGRMSARDIALRVRARRRVYEKYSHREPPKYVQGWRTFDDQLPDDGHGLRGVPASAGTVTGRARVCRKLEEVSKVEKGDILVTVATDPAWTTVFSFIGGVVVETGGVVAHAVMISREYGLPCVAHLTGACDLIPDGALITVDGAAGRVVIHEEAAGQAA